MNDKPRNLRLAGNNLPEGWALAELRDVLEVHYGKGLTKSVRKETGTVPVYGSNGMVGYHDVALVAGPCIIIGRKGAAGAVHYSAENCWPIDTTYYTCPPDGLSVKYMFYLLGFLSLEKLDRSTAIPGLNRDDLYAQKVPIPPLPEQHRIVAEIETQFSRLDAGVAALKRVQAALRRYKASVLKAACEGRLVPTEAELARAGVGAGPPRPYEPASALLERILAERRAKWERANPGKRYVEPKGVDGDGSADLPEGWVWATVAMVSQRMQYGTSEKTSTDVVGIPVLRMGNIKEGVLDFSDLKYLPEDLPSLTGLMLEDGDILFNRTNSAELVGKSAVYRESHPSATFASYLIRVTIDRNCEPYLLVYYINSVFGRSYIKSVVSQQVGQANVNGTKLANMPFPLPPMAEQHRIVAEVERRLSVAQEVEGAVAASLRRAERLRQSILKQAFAGRLVAQEADDEPGSALLERMWRQ